MNKLIATLPTESVQNGKNLGDKKETIETYNVVTNTDTGLREIIVARVYMSRSADGASPKYASIWIHDNKLNTAGHGSAKGYGYCKTSAAIGEAIRSAGIKLSRSIDGTGEHREALTAIAEALGYTDILIVRN
ncbi:MAG: hypothetical protein KAR06_04300 [Deltaproteobacteria bacterium]|nr:hypothetical protein [Deltaproteobacteria bacterium]